MFQTVLGMIRTVKNAIERAKEILSGIHGPSFHMQTAKAMRACFAPRGGGMNLAQNLADELGVDGPGATLGRRKGCSCGAFHDKAWGGEVGEDLGWEPGLRSLVGREGR